jgi:hypothetical protein
MVSRRELLEASGIGEEQLAELEEHGLVRRSGRLYGQDAVDVASTVALLASLRCPGQAPARGQTAAERDVALIEQVVAPSRCASEVPRPGRCRQNGRSDRPSADPACIATVVRRARPRLVCPRSAVRIGGARPRSQDHAVTSRDGLRRPESRVRAREAECGRLPRECLLLGCRPKQVSGYDAKGCTLTRECARARQGTTLT